MLINFSVKNFRSFRDLATLSMVATTDNDKIDNVISPEYSKLKLLNSAVIYGSNSAGKSNLIKALSAMKKIILSSSKNQIEEKIKYIQPFIFDDASKSMPTLFEVIFIIKGIRYQYGFTATQEKIYEEWLYSFPKSFKRVVFYRNFNSDTNEYEWETNNGKYLDANKEKVDLYKETTRDNELFLSNIVQLNNKEVVPVYDWFAKQFKSAGIDGWNDGEKITLKYLEQEEKKQMILNLLSDMDIHIDDIKVKEKDFDISDLDFKDNLPADIQEKLVEDFTGKKLRETQFLRTINNSSISLNLREESDGTQKIFGLLGPFMDTLENGFVLAIDELHNSLHPLLLKYLVQLFHSKDINRKNAQLIFTTHETEILNQDVFRRDQVWFVDKNSRYQTDLIPLTDYSPRKSEKLSKGYLSGRYGGTPNIEEEIKANIKKCFGM